ncbi:MAG TPA: glycosyltransferase [Candidatus Nitrosotalea sp.]|nr:glycosyltransferase [Candidatus Nitrosotalea sp.]
MKGSSADSAQGGAGLSIAVCVGATRSASLPGLIRAIRCQDWPEWDLLILGQGPREVALREAVNSASGGDPRIQYHHLDRSGLSRARNRSIELAANPIVAFTDDDCEPHSSWLSTLAAEFLADPALGVVGGAVLRPRARLGPLATCPAVTPSEALYEPGGDRLQPPPGWDWIGANFAIRREVALRIGSFDQCLGAGADFPAGEDTDYKLRLESSGIRMLSTPRSVVVHSAGVRRGMLAWHSQANYAAGNGAVAAKLTLMNDARGEQWLEETRSAVRGAGLRDPVRILPGARYARYARKFEAAYRRCLNTYRVSGGLLQHR